MATVTKSAANPAGRVIFFDESAHRYWTNAVEDFTSVTTFVKSWFPKFDADSVAKQVASRNGKTPSEVIAEWDVKRIAASEMGTAVHLACEMIMTGRPVPDSVVALATNERTAAIMRSAATACRQLFDMRFTVVGAEQIIFSERYGLAGTIDLAMRDSKGELWLLDWKTNESIKSEGFNGATGMGPAAGLPDCNLSHYSLQLSTYQRILRDEGYIGRGDVVHMALIHLTPESPNWIPVTYLNQEVADMILEHVVGGYANKGVPF